MFISAFGAIERAGLSGWLIVLPLKPLAFCTFAKSRHLRAALLECLWAPESITRRSLRSINPWLTRPPFRLVWYL